MFRGIVGIIGYYLMSFGKLFLRPKDYENAYKTYFEALLAVWGWSIFWFVFQAWFTPRVTVLEVAIDIIKASLVGLVIISVLLLVANKPKGYWKPNDKSACDKADEVNESDSRVTVKPDNSVTVEKSGKIYILAKPVDSIAIEELYSQNLFQ